MSHVYFLSAPRGAGKTTFCKRLTALARAEAWVVAGLLSPAIFEDGQKTGILAQDLQTDETRILAVAAPAPPAVSDVFCSPLGNWLFDPEVFTWGNRVLRASPPCDLLILDELGPLELIRGRGWYAALELLRQGAYKVGVVVIRPELLETAQRLFPNAHTIERGSAGDGLQAEQWFRQSACRAAQGR